MRLTTLLLAGGLITIGAAPLAGQSPEAPHPAGNGEPHAAVGGGERRHGDGAPRRRHHGAGEHAGAHRPRTENGHDAGGTMGPEDRAAAERRQREDSLAGAGVTAVEDSAGADSTAP